MNAHTKVRAVARGGCTVGQRDCYWTLLSTKAEKKTGSRQTEGRLCVCVAPFFHPHYSNILCRYTIKTTRLPLCCPPLKIGMKSNIIKTRGFKDVFPKKTREIATKF